MNPPAQTGLAPGPPPAGAGPRVVGNFLYLLLGQAAVAAFGVVSTAVLARTLGAEAYGILGLGTAILAYFGLLVVFGTDAWGVRAIAQDPAAAPVLVPRILGLRLVLLGALSIVYLLVIGKLGLPERARIVLAIQGLGLFATAFTLDFVFQAVQRMGTIALRQALAAALVLVAVLALVRAPGDLYLAAAIPPVAIGLSVVWLALRMRREVTPFGIEFDPPAWRTMFAAALPITIAQIMSTLFYNIDIVMLGFMASERQLGLYVAMTRVLQITLMLGGLIITVFTPVIAAAWPADGAMRDRYRDFVGAAMLIGAPVAALGIAYPVELVRIVFGDGYTAAAPALVLLLASAAIGYAGLAASTALIAWHDQTVQMIVYGIGGLSNVLFNLVLIPRYGIEGAAAATLASQLLITGGLALRAFIRFRVLALGPAAKLALCAAAAFAAIRGLDLAAGGPQVLPDIVRVIAAAAVGTALYLGLAALVRAADLRRLAGFLLARFGASPTA